MEKLWIVNLIISLCNFEFLPSLFLGSNINWIKTIAHTIDFCSLYVYLLVLESYISFNYATMLKYKY